MTGEVHGRAWRERLAGAVSERARLFLLSLAIAVTMWYYVTTGAQPAPTGSPTASLRLHNVPVTFSGLREGWRASATPPDVDIEMRWPATAQLAVNTNDVQAIADVAALDPGAHTVGLRIQVPAGVTAVQANPPAVTVRIVRSANP